MKIEDLTIMELIKICNERIGCLECPLCKAFGGLKIPLCKAPIKAVKDMEIDVWIKD